MSKPKKTWTLELLDEAFRPLIELEQDTSPQGRKRQRILRAPSELFEKHGYRKTSVDEIARKAEVAKGTVYLYYESKAKILVDVVGLQKKALWKAIEPLFTGEVPEKERLHYYMRVVLGSAREVPLVARLMRGDGELAAVRAEVGGDPKYQENLARGELWMAEMIEQAAPGRFSDEEKRARADALMTVAFLSGVLLEKHALYGRTYDDVVSTVTDMIVYGAVHRPPGKKK